MRKYYITSLGSEHGPFTRQEVATHVGSGRFSHDHMIWHDGIPNWISIREFMASEERSGLGKNEWSAAAAGETFWSSGRVSLLLLVGGILLWLIAIIVVDVAKMEPPFSSRTKSTSGTGQRANAVPGPKGEARPALKPADEAREFEFGSLYGTVRGSFETRSDFVPPGFRKGMFEMQELKSNSQNIVLVRGVPNFKKNKPSEKTLVQWLIVQYVDDASTYPIVSGRISGKEVSYATVPCILKWDGRSGVAKVIAFYYEKEIYVVIVVSKPNEVEAEDFLRSLAIRD